MAFNFTGGPFGGGSRRPRGSDQGGGLGLPKGPGRSVLNPSLGGLGGGGGGLGPVAVDPGKFSAISDLIKKSLHGSATFKPHEVNRGYRKLKG